MEQPGMNAKSRAKAHGHAAGLKATVKPARNWAFGEWARKKPLLLLRTYPPVVLQQMMYGAHGAYRHISVTLEHQICRTLCWIRYRRGCYIFEAQTVADQKHPAPQSTTCIMSCSASN